MERIPRLNAQNLSLNIREHLLINSAVLEIPDSSDFPVGPTISQFQPWLGYAGTVLFIEGSGFSNDRAGNNVRVAGKPALVVESSPTRLMVITHHETRQGPVEVTVNGVTATGSRDFEVLPWPKPTLDEDGPPFSFAGLSPSSGTIPSAGTVPPTGTARILVVTCYPTDLVPSNLTNARQDVIDTFADVTTFYDQASYGQLTVQVDVTNYISLLQNADYYHRANGAAGYPNIDAAVLGQLMAECAQGAVNQGFNLDNYSVMVASVYMPGFSVRAWGGWSQSNFAYDDGAGTSINITTTNPLGLIAQRHDADWGRAAHEFGHNLVDGGLVLGEDVYASDLIDPSEASAQNFEMMGSHDSHPLFSGFFMHQLGWYSSANVLELNWDRNPFSQTYELIAHGLSQDSTPNRYHLIRIRVSAGLYYFVEVRQRPDTTAQVFDENIPLPMGGVTDAGVIITKAITTELNNNHQTRLITLLQEQQRVLVAGEFAEDPLRTIRIEVIDDNVQERPRICRVRIEWAQEIVDNPTGDFDLRIEPWGPGWETEDIWVDRMPFGTYDFTDPSGNPTGNGDEPRPLEVNRFYARISCDGSQDGTNVKVTHYAISPPGVGDNGTWAPIGSYTYALIPRNGSVEQFVNWVPLVGEHTCLKVAVSQQLGEITGGNNQAQENVFNFQPPAASVPEPVKLTVAVRNPLKEKSIIFLSLENVPRGYYVYFPHRWVWLEGLGEKKLDLLVIPTLDLKERQYPLARVRLFGKVPRVYDKKIDMTGFPASWLTPIGGILAQVQPKRRGEIKLDEKVEKTEKGEIRVHGQVEPRIAEQALRVLMVRPDGTVVAQLTKTDIRGRFSADFSLKTLGHATQQRADETKQFKCYEFEAQIFNASQIAPTTSNTLCVHF